MNFVNNASCRDSNWSCNELMRCSIDVAESVYPFASCVSSPFAVSVYEFSVFLSLAANPLVESRKKLLTSLGLSEICCDNAAESSVRVPSWFSEIPSAVND